MNLLSETAGDACLYLFGEECVEKIKGIPA